MPDRSSGKKLGILMGLRDELQIIELEASMTKAITFVIRLKELAGEFLTSGTKTQTKLKIAMKREILCSRFSGASYSPSSIIGMSVAERYCCSTMVTKA